MKKLRQIFHSRKGVILVMTLSVMGAIFAFAASMLLAATSATGVVQAQYESAQAAIYARSLGETLEAELIRAGSDLADKVESMDNGATVRLDAAIKNTDTDLSENTDLQCTLSKSADGNRLTVSIISRYLKEENQLTFQMTRLGTRWGQTQYLPEDVHE